jgi:hypothetical protein
MKKLDRSVEKALLGEHYSEFQRIKEEYSKAIEHIKEHLKENPLTPLYENHIGGKIVVSDLGEIYLTVQALPSLNVLREMAERKNIDISDLGRSRKKIFDRIHNKNEVVSQNKESTTSKGNSKNKKKAQDISKTYIPNNTENQSNSKEKNDNDFDFLDDVEDDDLELSKADIQEDQTDEEKNLLAQMISLGSRGGSLDRVIDKVDLDGILKETDR